MQQSLTIKLKLARLKKKDRNNSVTFALVKKIESYNKDYQQGKTIREELISSSNTSTIIWQTNMDLEMLASISNFSPYHFHRITKAFLGEPIGAFVTRLRVETAARLLRYGDMPIQNIAYRVGYNVPFSLSKAFKQFYGITLTEYKNNYCFFGNNIL